MIGNLERKSRINQPKEKTMREFRQRSCSAAVGLFLLGALAVQLTSQAPKKYYIRWQAGARNVDQSTEQVPQHSGLWSWKGTDNVRDDDFANIVKPYLARGAYFFYSFSQCFGGGMFDELSGLGGLQSGISASTYNQKARYPSTGQVGGVFMYTGNGYDFTFAFLRSLLLPNLASERIAAFASANDPWGTNPNPFPPRKGETQNTETPVYFAQSAILAGLAFTEPAEQSAPLAPQQKPLALLWSGEPNQIDRDQTALMVRYLRLLGYPIDRIYVMYGQGQVAPNNPVAIAFANQFGALPNAAFMADHLRMATKKQLSAFLQSKFPNPDPQKISPAYVVFFANDHGFNTAFAGGAAVPRDGGSGVPADAGTPDDTWVGGANTDATPL